MFKEFKEFALKGNLLDTAVAFVMGAAFGKVITSFVEKCFAPITGLLMGGVDFNEKKLVLREAAPAVKDAMGNVATPEAAELAVSWGAFLTACIDFLVVAFVMFLLVKTMNRLKLNTPPPPPTPSEEYLKGILEELRKGK